jgi:DNA-binding beta-propeller fold protein YncE
MSQNDYTITTDPSGALLQDIMKLTYTNTDLSYIPQYNHTYELTNVELQQEADYFVPYAGPASILKVGYMTYDYNLLKVFIANNDFLSMWTGSAIKNVYRFADLSGNITTRGIAYNRQNNLIYAARVTATNSGGIILYSSQIFAVNVLLRTQTIVNVSDVTFNALRGMAFDMSNNLIVADKYNNNIFRIVFSDDTTGSGIILAGAFSGMNAPGGVAVDNFNNIYVSNMGNNNIVKISNPSLTISIIASGLPINNPRQIQYNLINNIIYVTNYGNPDTSDSSSICSISNGVVSIFYTNPPDYHFYGLAIDISGDIYYNAGKSNVDYVETEVYFGKLDNIYTGSNAAYYYTAGSGRKYVIHPTTSVALNYMQNRLYTSEYKAPWPDQSPFDPSYNSYPYGLIWWISLTDPSYVPVLFYPINTLTDPGMNNPTSIAFDSYYNLYVGNSIDSKILVIDSSANGTYLNITSGVTTDGPTGLVFDNTSHLYFANYLNNTICKLTFTTPTTATGVYIDISGAAINKPIALAIDNSNNVLYILNYGLNNIVSVDLDTNNARIYNSGNVGLTNPRGLVYDSTRGLLYISNSGLNNIEVLANNGEINTLYDISFNNSIIYTSSPVEINLPQGLAIDMSNNILYVANYGSQTDALVKINIDISSNLLYDTYQNSFGNARNVAIWYDSPYQISYIFVASIDLVILTNDGISILYGSHLTHPSLQFTNSCTVTDCFKNAVGYFPYYIYDSTSPNAIYAAVPDISVPFDINTSPPIIGPITITGYTPTYSNNLNVTFESPDAYFDMSAIIFYVSDSNNPSITRVVVSPTDVQTSYFNGVGNLLNIDFTSSSFRPGSMAVYGSTGPILDRHPIMYCIEEPSLTIATIRVCQIDLTAIGPSPYTPTIIATFTNTWLNSSAVSGINVDIRGYMYAIISQQPNGTLYYYRITPAPDYTIESLVSNNDVISTDLQFGKNTAYSKWDNSIVIACVTSIQKIYLSFQFTCSSEYNIDKYSNTLYIGDVLSATGPPTFDLSFNVYEHYIIIDPDYIPPDTATNTSFYFINPSVLPNPTDTYYLLCGTNKIADAFCNNCTYNKSKFLSGTYPTGLVYSNYSNNLYVALQNNTISRINSAGIVQNNYISTSVGLQGPTSILLDASFNMYILNVTGGFITKLTLTNEIITANNNFYTNIEAPICLAYDYISNNYLYLLSGNVPNMVITRIDITNSANTQYLPIPFGELYNSNGLIVGAPTIYEKYLYVSNTDQFEVNSIKKFNLLDASFNLTTEISGLSYKPYTLDFIGQYLYVSNKSLPSSISKIRVANQTLGITASAVQPWAVNGISVPSGLVHDQSGNLYIANTGTGPRNSRISKIVIDYFPFDNVVLLDGTCANAQIYNVTEKQLVPVYYDPSNNYIFPIPFPGPS